ncbi:MAG: hypothetical protein DHS20C21_07570 [Gemmatimonadota bacterium]|nr:MAG: hypothetical protein DHS20C21_07570 [Gemmatimonadota bacterium]
MRSATGLFAVALFTMATFGSAQAGPWYAKGDHVDAGAGVWNSSAANEMFDDGTSGDAVSGDGIHTRDVVVDQAVGRHEFKVALDDWSVAYPGTNQWVHINTAGETITMTLDTNFYADDWIPNENIVWNSNAMPPGSTPEVIGAAPEIGAWTSGVPGTLSGSVWSVSVNVATPGLYEYKWRANGNWDDFAFGLDGASSAGGNLGFETTSPDEPIRFELDVATGRARVVYEGTVSVESDTWSGVKALYR